MEQDYLKAAGWYGKAVTEKNPFAAYTLGSLYHRGQGVTQNEEEAYRLFLMAANHQLKPNAYAQYELGRMCKLGVGNEKNEVRSSEWYKKAYQSLFW